MDELDDEGFFDGEKPLLGRIMFELVKGKSDALIEFLTRQEPISPSAAYFVGSFIKEGIGDYAFRLERVFRRGAPRTDSLVRASKAALWVHWTVNKPNNGRRNPKREDAIRRAARRYHVDAKRVREELSFFEQFHAMRPREFRRKFKQLTADFLVDMIGSNGQQSSFSNKIRYLSKIARNCARFNV